MSVKPDFESYTAHGVVVGPNELVVEQSVRLEMIKLLLPQNILSIDISLVLGYIIFSGCATET